MFGCPLEEHLRLFKTDVAVVLEACCQALRDQWMDTEGLFRIAAGTARVRLLKVHVTYWNLYQILVLYEEKSDVFYIVNLYFRIAGIFACRKFSPRPAFMGEIFIP